MLTFECLQDFKLHILRWQFLPSLGHLLHELSTLLLAANYADHYRRDLGMSALSSTTVQASGLIPILMYSSCGTSDHTVSMLKAHTHYMTPLLIIFRCRRHCCPKMI